MSENENPHQQHRERMREKYLRVGLDGFNEHEILEFLLYYCIARRDTNALAHTLIRTFGSFAGVLAAPVEELCRVEGVGERTAVFLKLLYDISQNADRYESEREPLSSVEKIGEYIRPFYQGISTEQVLVLALDSRLRPIRAIRVQQGSMDTVALPIVKVARTLVSCGASFVVLSHNHPNGTALPSQKDVQTTQQLQNVLAGVGIQLIDHLIFDREDYISLRDSNGNLVITSH